MMTTLAMLATFLQENLIIIVLFVVLVFILATALVIVCCVNAKTTRTLAEKAIDNNVDIELKTSMRGTKFEKH